jgi:hypothetical protein
MLPLFAISLANVTGLLAQPRPEFSLKIHPIRDTFAVRDTITLEVTTTNLTDRTLDPMKWAMPYTYVVTREGVPATKIEHSEMINLPKALAPHSSETGDVYVQHHVDMTQPGKYTIQLRKDGVKSNIVTLTVEP